MNPPETGDEGRFKRLVVNAEDEGVHGRSPDFWRVAAEASEDAIFGIDHDGRVREWTTSASRLFGYDLESITSRPSTVLFGEHVAEAHAERVTRALSGERIERVRLEGRRSDGMAVPLSLTLLPVPDGAGVCALARDLTEQQTAQAALAESELRLREAQELSHVGLWLWDVAHDSLHLSDELYKTFGMHPADFDGTFAAFIELVHPDDRSDVKRAIPRMPEHGAAFDYEFRIVRPTGEVRWVHAQAAVELDADGRIAVLRGIGQDITERTLAAHALARHASLVELLRRMAVAANEASTLEDALRVSMPEVCRHTGWQAAAVQFAEHGRLAGGGALWYSSDPARFEALRQAMDITPLPPNGAGDRALKTARPAWETDYATLAGDLGVPTAIAFPITIGSEVIALLRFFSPSADEPDAELIDTVWDGANQLGRVVERLRSRDELSHQALHDSLTGLPNRALLLDRIGQAMAKQDREASFVAVIFLDLDNFKLINDSLGHDAGDRLLVTIARRLSRTMRAEDTAARFGGDEFIILCDRLPSEEAAVDLAERILGVLAEPVALVGANEVVVTASAGIAIAHGAEVSPESLLRDADAAMYRAKEAGRGRYQIFDAAMHQRAMHRLGVAGELRTGIANGELRLVYQPQVDIATGRMVGVEALVRWQHPTRGLLGPYEFIEVAEETHLIVPLGSWVIREACKQAAEWRVGRSDAERFKVCVNVSAKQLGRSELVDDVARALRETRLAPERLCLEITESVLMGDSDYFMEALLGIKMLGVDVAIDDFGTGYSSLAYLRRYPIDVIKVDKGFVDGLATDDTRAHAVVAAVIDLAHALDLVAVAEGVETADQLHVLERLGCDMGQGYHFAKPMPPEMITALLAAREDAAI